jgi:hypothetical protein
VSISIGDRATVTIAIHGPDRPGEVRVETAGGSQLVRAFASEDIPPYASVVVYDVRPGGVDVGEIGKI